MSAKTYVARRVEGQLIVTVRSGEREHPLRHIAYHSPTGFEVGYAGSGPADLALSILVDALGEGRRWRLGKGEQWHSRVPSGSRAWRLHQQLKRDIVARADQAGFELSEEELRSWIDEQGIGGPDEGVGL